MSIGYRALLFSVDFSAGHDPVFERPRKYTIQTSDARFLAMLMTVLRSPSYWCRREDAVKDARFCCEKWRGVMLRITKAEVGKGPAGVGPGLLKFVADERTIVQL
jgi:hypothetical protein